MKKYRWQLLIILVTGLIVGVLLIIQQMDDGEAIESAPSPITGGIYTEALIGDFMRLNPILDVHNSPDRAVDQLIFSGLVKFDYKGIPQTDLAESWGVSKDGTVYNFSLRTDVYWHDGEVFDSRDVLFTISLLQSEHGLVPEDLRSFWSDVEVVLLSDSQLQFLLPEPFAPFLDYLTFGILPEHILSGLGLDGIIDHPFNLAPIGTGPFRFQRLLVEDGEIAGVVLDAFDDYFMDRPYLDEFIFRYYPTSDYALSAYLSGEVEGIGDVDNSILGDVLSDADLAVYSARVPVLKMVYLNLDNPEVNFLQNPTFRKALLSAINIDLIINRVYEGQAIQANGPILPGTWAYYEDIEKVNFDLNHAQTLFESTGASHQEEQDIYLTEEGLEIEVTLLHPEDPRHTETAAIIQSNWEALGVIVNLEPKPYEEVLSDLTSRSYQAALVDINLMRSPDPDPYPFWGQAQLKSGQNYAEWDNRSASEFLEQARMTVDLSDRERLYRNFQVLFMRELPSLPILYPVYSYAISNDINGVNLGPIFEPSDRFNNVHDWFILSSMETSPTEASDQTTE